MTRDEIVTAKLLLNIFVDSSNEEDDLGDA